MLSIGFRLSRNLYTAGGVLDGETRAATVVGARKGALGITTVFFHA